MCGPFFAYRRRGQLKRVRFPSPMTNSRRIRPDFIASALIVLAVAALVFVVFVEWVRYTALFFFAILIAVALAAFAERLSFRGRFPHAAGLALTLGILLALVGGLGWWIGPQLAQQFEQLSKEVPRGLDEARRWLESTSLGDRLPRNMPDIGDAKPGAETMLQKTGRFVGAGLAVVADFFILLALAIFIAASPGRYRSGALRLLPPRHRERGSEVLCAMGGALRRWLLARGALMLLVTVLLGVGLAILGVPLALPLALLAGLLSFVPYVGPTVASVPAVAMGLLESPMHAVYVAILYMGVQLLESYVVEPLVEARAVSLPPALIIAAQVFCVMWLGPMGVLLATPLLVVVVVAVQMLYLRDGLGETVEVIGE